MNGALFGIDLGGTKTEGVVLLADGSEALRHRLPTIPGSYAATLTTIKQLVATLEARSGLACQRLGIGIPGSVSPATGLVRNANSTWINGQPFHSDIAAALDRPVRIANDANCLALSEARDGAGAGADPLFAVILGTGVGGGLVIGGRIVVGAHGLGGEWGHVPLAGGAVAGAACFCGRSGCNETWLSGPALLRDHLANGGQSLERVEEVVELARAGDKAASAALARYRERLARALGSIVNIVDPAMIVLGGGVSNLPGLAEDLPGLIARHIFAAPDDRVTIRVVRAHWGDSSGVRGAARLWEAEE
ncbi:MAG: ROK family protein [Rhodobacteraceae bacterium]|nr:ROK family protein [Paracoccaceae bacterium]